MAIDHYGVPKLNLELPSKIKREPNTPLEEKIPSDLIRIKDAAVVLDSHPNTIRNLIPRGQLRAYRIGARIVRVSHKDVLGLFTSYVGGEFGVWK
jgi:excisionase family DNA binding protein